MTASFLTIFIINNSKWCDKRKSITISGGVNILHRVASPVCSHTIKKLFEGDNGIFGGA